jgi:hypothetical protein
MKILLVEDDIASIKSCKKYASIDNRGVSIEVAQSTKDAKGLLNKDIDAAIIDMKLKNVADAGDLVINEINELCLRIPTVVHTGTPDNVKAPVLKVFTRGECTYEDMFNYLFDIQNTGIVNILGKKGVLEQKLTDVYTKNIIPIINNSWICYGKKNAALTEKAFLRYTLNHLLQILENVDDVEKCYPEEMYIYPPIDDNYRTGSILKSNQEGYFIVLSPACDLALHNGSFKTDKVLLVEIKKIDEILSLATRRCKSDDEKKQKLHDLYCNTYSLYYHWLPKVSFFDGGVINFRRINSFAKKDLKKIFSKPQVQIAPFFCKDIVARFSSYYARQGQPDIDLSSFI